MYRNYYQKQVNQNGVITIAKVYDIYNARRSNINVEFKYSYNGKTYHGIKSVDGDPHRFLNRYFQIKISKDNPEKYIIYLDKPITDSLRIHNSNLDEK